MKYKCKHTLESGKQICWDCDLSHIRYFRLDSSIWIITCIKKSVKSFSTETDLIVVSKKSLHWHASCAKSRSRMSLLARKCGGRLGFPMLIVRRSNIQNVILPSGPEL